MISPPAAAAAMSAATVAPHAGALDWLAAAGVLLAFVVAVSWMAAAIGLVASSPEAANVVHVHRDVPAVREQRVRPGRHDAVMASGLRRPPAGHPGHGDAARPPAGHAGRERAVDGARMVRGHPRRVDRGV